MTVRKYSIIRNNKVINVIDADEAFVISNFPDDLVYTGELPIGWEFNPNTNRLFNRIDMTLESSKFAPTAKFLDTAVRTITKRSFMQRFTQAERIAIRNSTDDIVIDIQEDLNSTDKVDLDLPALSAGLGYLVSLGILQSNRPAELTVDGTEEEKYV